MSVEVTWSRTTGAAAAVLAAAALSLTACGDSSEVPEAPELLANDVADDGEWIRLDGTVVSTAPSQFVLDYGADVITVEMDDWDPLVEGQSLLAGDRVSVTGKVDENLFNSRSIEASAVFLHKFNAVYFANAADEEEIGITAVPQREFSEGADYTGWVTGMTENGFTLGTGPIRIAVDTSQLPASGPASEVDTGDRVYVWGNFRIAETGTSMLTADGLVELLNSSRAASPLGPASAGDPPTSTPLPTSTPVET